VIGVDKHVWRNTRRGDKYVTVIIDLTPVHTKTERQGCSTWSKAAPNERSRPGWLPPAILARRHGSRCHGPSEWPSAVPPPTDAICATL
jgi:hypothetical protein